jgi:hypothetical protein
MYSKGIDQLKFSFDGRKVLTRSLYNGQMWEVASGQTVGEPMMYSSSGTHSEFSPDDQRIVTADEKTAQMWSAATGLPLGRPLNHDSTVLVAMFTADGKRLVTVTGDRLHWWVETSTDVWEVEETIWSQRGGWFATPRLLNPSGSEVLCAERWTGDAVLIRKLTRHSAESGLPEIRGDWNQLLINACQRFSLRFKDELTSPLLTPIFPIQPIAKD